MLLKKLANPTTTPSAASAGLMFSFVLFLAPSLGMTQSRTLGPSDEGWVLETSDPKAGPGTYYGVTLANGMIGIVTAAEPLRTHSTVLNGTYDFYGRGRTTNILQGFNFADLLLDIDGERIHAGIVTGHTQRLDMRRAVFESRFKVRDKAEVVYRIRALRHLPHTALIEMEVTALKDLSARPASEISAPLHLRDVRQRYAVIDRPHVKIPLMTSSAMSPTGRHSLAVSTSVIENGAIGAGQSKAAGHGAAGHGRPRMETPRSTAARRPPDPPSSTRNGTMSATWSTPPTRCAGARRSVSASSAPRSRRSMSRIPSTRPSGSPSTPNSKAGSASSSAMTRRGASSGRATSGLTERRTTSWRSGPRSTISIRS